MPLRPTGLPIEDSIAAIVTALRDSGQAVLTAEPGAGKSTVVPLRLLDEPWLAGRTILLLEPRRVAARAVARRMARLLGEETGETVGWVTRDDRSVGPRTRVLVVTDGVLTARLVDDPGLDQVGLVIFDEFHERSLPADLGLALFLLGRRRREHDCRLLVMSATLDADAVAAHLGGAPTVTAPGRSFPVEISWRPRKRRDPLAPAVVRAVREALHGPGDVLVFLPGVGEIRAAEHALRAEFGRDGPAVLPLHGSLPPVEQDAALISRAERRVVLATNVAETSLTVDGIATVVDTGLERRARFDARTGMAGLVLAATSKASAEQRAGRAGRLGPGTAIRLWSKAEHAARPPVAPAAILEEDLASLVLDLARRGVEDPADVPFLTGPDPERWEAAVVLLRQLGAIDADGAVTANGRDMATLPVHPRLARCVVGARHPWLACLVAAALDERDVLRGRVTELPVDLEVRVRLIADRAAAHEAADGGAIRRARERARQLARRAGTEPDVGPPAFDRIGDVLAAGFPDRVARRVPGIGGAFVTASGIRFRVDRRQTIADAAGIVAVDVSRRGKQGTVNRAAPLEARLDHLVYATPDLDRTVADIARDWGVQPAAGGRHDGRGTHNALLALGSGAYLEIIGPDPEQPEPEGPRPFGVDDITEPRLVTWAAAVPDLAAWMRWCEERKIDAGAMFDMQRTTPAGTVLRWRLTSPPPLGDGVVPFLIEWPGATPAESAPTGVELFGFELAHPEARVRSRLAEYALRYPVDDGPAELRATLMTPSGLVDLRS